MMENLTLQQRLHNAFGVQAVENIKTEHAYLSMRHRILLKSGIPFGAVPTISRGPMGSDGW